MALKHHMDASLRMQQQIDNCAQFVLPFIEQSKSIRAGMKVLEIGCGEGGVLKPFIDRGCECVGVDLDPPRIDIANQTFFSDVQAGKVIFLLKNVYDLDFVEKYKHYFDLIVLKDTIEHVPNQEGFIPHLRQFLAQDGKIFFGFPPWQMPFGGHQQVCLQKLSSKLPYYHLLPAGIYKVLLKWMGETPDKIRELIEIKDTGISIERFERIVRKNGFNVFEKTHFLINPIYRYKFGWEPKKQFAFISAIPYFRNFLTTCVYYLIG
jgi:SAM-dependent methyltransferase